MKNYLTKALVKEIKKGGIIIAPRQSGKTQAIIEVLREQTENGLLKIPHKEIYLMVCHSKQSCKIFRENYPDFAPLIFPPRKIENPGKVILDEYYWNPYKGKFHAAISSNNNRMVIYNKTRRRIKIELDERL